jgi:hypothetical protein
LVAGPASLAPLPTPDQLAAVTEAERFELLDGLRGELYAVSAVLADRVLRRAWEHRSAFPPYGLARSLFSQLRAVSIAPVAFEEGSIADFRGLGKAYVDTVVFHLDRALAEVRQSELAWLTDRLEQLLELFRSAATPSGQSRIRDPFSFLYGGLHFGTSVCVELVEVMDRLLAAALAPAERVATIRRSVRPAFQLAGLNLEDVPRVYQRLHDAGGARSPQPGWMAPEWLVITEDSESGARIDLRPGVITLARRAGAKGEGKRYTTRGCPARNPLAAGASGGIGLLWAWGVDLAVATGLLGDG